MNRPAILLLSLGLASSAPAQTFEKLDQIVAAERASLAGSCKAIELTDEFLTRQNMNGDALEDIFIDYGGVVCEGVKRALCGGAGCSMTLYLQQPNGGFTHLGDYFARGIDFDRPGAKPPSFVVALHGNECSRSGIEPCNIRYRIEENAAVEVGEVSDAEPQ